MIIAESLSGEKVNARNAFRKETYVCSVCKSRVILKKGHIKIPHFSHKHDRQCLGNSEGETAEHLKGKKDLYDWLVYAGIAPELEVYIEEISQRADLLFIKDEQIYAIEYQCSVISEKEVIERTRGYHSIGIKPIWIAGSKLSIKDKLSNLNRLFIIKYEQVGQVHLYYNTDSEQLTISLLSLSSFQRNKKQVLALNKFGSQLVTQMEIKPISFYPADKKTKRKQLEYLHKMRHYNVRQYRTLFEFMYANHLIIDQLPGVIFSEVTDEWMIRTLPAEWKLRLIIWLKRYPEHTPVTKHSIEIEWQSLTDQKLINWYTLPNLPDHKDIVLSRFILLLESENYLLPLNEARWAINKDKYN